MIIRAGISNINTLRCAERLCFGVELFENLLKEVWA